MTFLVLDKQLRIKISNYNFEWCFDDSFIIFKILNVKFRFLRVLYLLTMLVKVLFHLLENSKWFCFDWVRLSISWIKSISWIISKLLIYFGFLKFYCPFLNLAIIIVKIYVLRQFWTKRQIFFLFYVCTNLFNSSETDFTII